MYRWTNEFPFSGQADKRFTGFSSSLVPRFVLSYTITSRKWLIESRFSLLQNQLRPYVRAKTGISVAGRDTYVHFLFPRKYRLIPLKFGTGISVAGTDTYVPFLLPRKYRLIPLKSKTGISVVIINGRIYLLLPHFSVVIINVVIRSPENGSCCWKL